MTAKGKLREILSDGLDFSSGLAISFSAEKTDQVTSKQNGVADILEMAGLDLPDFYSAETGLFVPAAGYPTLPIS